MAHKRQGRTVHDLANVDGHEVVHEPGWIHNARLDGVHLVDAIQDRVLYLLLCQAIAAGPIILEHVVNSVRIPDMPNPRIAPNDGFRARVAEAGDSFVPDSIDQIFIDSIWYYPGYMSDARVKSCSLGGGKRNRDYIVDQRVDVLCEDYCETGVILKERTDCYEIEWL